MYLKLSEITLVRNQQRYRKHSDVVIYQRDYRGDTIFTLDNQPSHHASEAVRYGTLYYDASDEPCVVPDAWSEGEAYQAKSFNDN